MSGYQIEWANKKLIGHPVEEEEDKVADSSTGASRQTVTYSRDINCSAHEHLISRCVILLITAWRKRLWPMMQKSDGPIFKSPPIGGPL